MSRLKRKRQKKILIAAFLVIFLCLGILAGLIFSGMLGGDRGKIDENASELVETENYDGRKNTETIDIPGLGTLTFKAGETKQTVHFYNPPQNSVYFKMTLQDNRGNTLWQSDLVPPGKEINEITLKEVIPKGTYEGCSLLYETFGENGKQFNGSSINFTLEVK